MISVIVPVYNDPVGIQETLLSLLEQDYPHDKHEIIIVDNNSKDETKYIAESIADGQDHVCVLTEKKIQSSYAARNTGIAASNGDLLAFIDADMTVPRTWLSDIATAFDNTGADYIACNVETYIPNGSNTLAAKYNSAIEFPIRYLLEEMKFAPTCCLAIRRSVIEEVGKFDERLISGGDNEFGQRVVSHGFKQVYMKDITMRHPARDSFEEIIKKGIRVGVGVEQLHELHPNIQPLPWYHPKNVLPPSPISFRKQLDKEYAIFMLVLFYSYSYIHKLSKLYGRLTTAIDN